MTLPASAQKKARWRWLLLASFAIFLVVLAPAALLEFAIGRATNSPIRFNADAGTVWAGRGRIALAADGTNLVIPIAWRFDAGALPGLRLGFVVETNAPALSGRTRLGLRFGDVELRDTALTVDARVLTFAHSAVALLTPSGKVTLQQAAGERLVVRPATNNAEAWRVDGAMNLSAAQFAFGGVVNAPAGDHELKLQGNGATVNVTVLRSSGPLKLDGAGTVTLAAPRRFTFTGFATAASDAPAALKQLGPTMADGRQRIELNTAW